MKDNLRDSPEVRALEGSGFEIVSEMIANQGDPAKPASTPADTPSATPPKTVEPPVTPPVKDGGTPAAPDKGEIERALVNEIFGGKFKTLDEVRAAKITDQLKEIDNLREKTSSLEQQVKGRPLGYADEDMVLFNEFVKKTGIKNQAVFNKLMKIDIDKLDNPMDMMILKEIVEKPKMIGNEEFLRKKLTDKYGVNEDEIDADELKINKIQLEADAENAAKYLRELKSGIKLPEVAPPPAGEKSLTAEQQQKIETGWKATMDKINEEWKTIPIPLKGNKNAIINYDIPQSVKQSLTKDAYDYCVENHMELNENNLKTVFGMMQKDLLVSQMSEIVSAVADKIRGMTKEEYDKVYENPSIGINTDQPTKETLPDSEADRREIYEAERKRISGK